MSWINDCFNYLHDLYSQRSKEAESEFKPLLPEQEGIREFMEQSEDDVLERIRRWM